MQSPWSRRDQHGVSRARWRRKGWPLKCDKGEGMGSSTCVDPAFPSARREEAMRTWNGRVQKVR